MNVPQPQPDSLVTDYDELARIESMISRCEARITAQLELLACLSPWEAKSETVRQEVDVEEGVLHGLHAQKLRLLSVFQGPPKP